MKRLAVAASILSGVMMATPGGAQQKLGDVAGSIKLKKTGEESVVIDGSDVGRTSGRSASGTALDQLYDILGDCLDVSRELSSLTVGAPRIMPVTYSDEWKTQLDGIGDRLESLELELQRQPEAGPAEAAYQRAVAGCDQVSRGDEAALTATNSYRLVTSAEKRSIAEGVDTIALAMSEMRTVNRSRAASATPPPIDPIAAANSIRRVCSRSGAEGSAAYSDCVEEQDAAKYALIGRTGPAVGLDTASFNKIRNGCLYEWPDNFVNRNACETRRAAAAARR